jgi:hypothetical protein
LEACVPAEEKEYTGSADELLDIFGPDTDESPDSEPAAEQPRRRAAAAESSDDESDDEDDFADEEDDDSLTAEERVAAAVRQDLEEQGLLDDEEPDEQAAGAEGEDEDEEETLEEKVQRLEAEAARAANYDAYFAEEEFRTKDKELRDHADREYLRAKRHYAGQVDKAIARVETDAANTADPDAYIRTNRQGAINAVMDAWESWQSRHVAETNTKLEANQRERDRPLFAQYLIEELGLPDSKRVRSELMKKKTVEDMQERAYELQRMQQVFARLHDQNRQAKLETKAHEVAKSQPHPKSSGKPARRRQTSYKGTADELRYIEALPD